MGGSDSDDDDKGGGKGSAKSRRELPAGAVSTLKAWLLSPEHFTHPYPTPQDQVMLMQKTGIDKKQLKNWFTNARRRIWKPMLKKQLEQGKLAATGAGGGGVAVPGVVQGLLVPTAPGAPPPGVNPAYQQPVPQQQQPQQYDQYGNPIYPQQAQTPHPGAPVQQGQAQPPQQYYQPQYGQPQAQQDMTQAPAAAQAPIAPSGSIGSLPPVGSSGGLGGMLSKNDSHAVLMELFARDQDLVRQATESKKPGMTSSMKFGSSTLLNAVPSLNSWPHFSSISSLNNLGTMTGVKSITSLSGADLASQGNLNKGGNLAQVKSLESMGKHDSYAFLEVFFGDRTSSTNLSAKDQESRGVKREREEDNDVGLSLDAEESPSPSATLKQNAADLAQSRTAGAPPIVSLSSSNKDSSNETGTLKRAYDDALAARGLISVSRSCEKLTDLALPAKMQRTLSQEFMRQQQQQLQQQQQAQAQAPQYAYAPAPTTSDQPVTTESNQQYPGQQPTQEPQTTPSYSANPGAPQTQQVSSSNASTTNASVEVPTATKCVLCHQTDIDTQLNPCGHYFHHKCLKPSLQTPMGQPKCPICRIPIQSALLAVPTDEQRVESTPTNTWSIPGAPVMAETSGSKA